MGVKIVAVGFDTPQKNTTWANNQNYKYEIWSDTQRDLANYYGANNVVVPKRVTRLLDASGKLIVVYTVGMTAGAHPQQVLDDCKILFEN
ncbi:MAG: redoxin domain-containing protein [Proteobacteria bacterium]|nr:redoxin domain-containing protein [Pseudomonadota bacterium]